ncbi:hypothetical protein ACBI99_44710 [Nonomuraea sp. ATR24]|uniref:hypothetical protein n=1 Tax=Nonomuraea sp. ATR24 TaxID=1676744 RepID=UPI0035BEE96A
MARTALTAVASSEDGINLAAVDSPAELTDGNSFVWTATRKVWILNGDDAALTVTFPTPATVGRGQRAVADGGGSIPAGEHRLYGPFGPEFRQADGTVHIDYAGTTPSAVTTAVLD